MTQSIDSALRIWPKNLGNASPSPHITKILPSSSAIWLPVFSFAPSFVFVLVLVFVAAGASREAEQQLKRLASLAFQRETLLAGQAEHTKPKDCGLDTSPACRHAPSESANIGAGDTQLQHG